MQPPVWAKVWATNGVRLWRKRVAGEPNHLKESQIWVTSQIPIFKTLSLFVSHSHQHLPEALKRSAGRGRGWPAKNRLLAFSYYHDDGSYDGGLQHHSHPYLCQQQHVSQIFSSRSHLVLLCHVQLQLGVDVEGVCKAKVGHLHLDQIFFRFYETKIPATNIQVT